MSSRHEEDPFRRELNSLKGCFEAGVLPAAMDAAFYCEKWDLLQPAWLKEALLELAGIAVIGAPRRKGRAGNPLARMRQDLIHFTRYDLICEFRCKQKEIPQMIAETEAAAPDWPGLEFDRRIAAAIGTTWPEAFAATSRVLRYSPAFGCAEAMKASYQLVRDSGKDPSQRYRFHLLSRQTYRELGLESLLDEPQGKFLDLLFGSA